jgi:hypothetical protein
MLQKKERLSPQIKQRNYRKVFKIRTIKTDKQIELILSADHIKQQQKGYKKISQENRPRT